MVDLNFNSADHEPLGTFEVVPKGDYLAIITDSEMKPTKAGDGQYLQLSIQLLETEYKGQILWERLNLFNKNETAVKIANSTLSSICIACGVPAPKKSEELHNKAIIIKVGVVERKDRPGEFSNEIKGYSATGGIKKAVEPSSISGVPPWKVK
jgi:hypothetical protein